MEKFSIIQNFAIWVLPVLFAITVHEVAHGWVASKLGDKTAQMLGRITLNPIKHIDPIGTLVLPALLILSKAGFVFGWAKPVPVNYFNLRNPKRDMAIVAAAGPLSNLFMAFFWGAIMRTGAFTVQSGYPVGVWLFYMGNAGVLINIWLMVLNFLPIPPLDGSRVLVSLLPQKAGQVISRAEPFGFIILLGLLFSGILGAIILPPAQFLINLVTTTYGF